MSYLKSVGLGLHAAFFAPLIFFHMLGALDSGYRSAWDIPTVEQGGPKHLGFGPFLVKTGMAIVMLVYLCVLIPLAGFLGLLTSTPENKTNRP